MKFDDSNQTEIDIRKVAAFRREVKPDGDFGDTIPCVMIIVSGHKIVIDCKNSEHQDKIMKNLSYNFKRVGW